MQYSEDIELFERMHEAFTNSYNVIVKHTDPVELIEQEGDVVFAHDINKPLKKESVTIMISYWEDEEEYEMCAILKKLENGFTKVSESHSHAST